MANVASARRSSTIGRVVMVTIAVIVIVPTTLVVGIERAVRSSGNAAAELVVATAAEAARIPPDQPAALHELAASAHVRLWIVDPKRRTTLFASDREDHGRSDLRLPSLGLDPGIAETFEAGRPSPWAREHAVVAGELGQSAGCATYADDRLAVCEAAVRRADQRVALVQLDAPRVTSRLADVRGGLLVLAAVVLLVGATVSLWLVRRLVRPLTRLGEQVEARSRAGGEAIAFELAGAPREIAAVASTIDRLAAELETRARDQARTTADLAHELKSPLARIRLAVDAQGGPELREALAQQARAAVVEIDRIVADLLSIARVEAGADADARQVVELGVLAAAVVEQRPAPARLTVHEVPGANAISSSISEVSVARALGHLLDNAYAFARAEVAVELSAIGDRARISVTDDGPGVPAELVPRLFERFASRRPGGSGLGLAFVRAVARAHGGDAFLEPRGVVPGTRFVLELPVHTAFTSG